ncbi:hypothetical protein [Arthrobacter sp. Leaf69]|uniref:hypothetical protein n=1 Tax=Arthrobacter sp. Leaf69 TaxID=1736232 RepID=UPI0006F703AC|nr:hypothetical protein [Arthrobacter sp. Leaf69]KQN95086.1 hypothetical protein ASE96_02545 [Arthrobacter sp. Leaf69]
MTPAPSPTPVPVEVFIHSGPAEWWQILAALGPLAVLFGAGIAGFIGWNTLKQKSVADNRAEWWKRTQWALDAVYSGDTKRGTVGLKVLCVLGESELAGSGELAVLEAAWEEPLNAAERQLAVEGRTARAPGAVDKDERAMEVAAARLRLLTDQRLGKPTPEWVTTLAAE